MVNKKERFKWNALFELPLEHGNRFLRRARKLIEMLHKNTDNWIRQKNRAFFVSGPQTGADAFKRGFYSAEIDDVGFDSAWRNGAGSPAAA